MLACLHDTLKERCYLQAADVVNSYRDAASHRNGEPDRRRRIQRIRIILKEFECLRDWVNLRWTAEINRVKEQMLYENVGSVIWTYKKPQAVR